MSDFESPIEISNANNDNGKAVQSKGKKIIQNDDSEQPIKISNDNSTNVIESKINDEKCDIIDNKKFKPKINVGIDFGTDGTAIGYSFPGGKDVFIYGKWSVFGKNRTTKTNKTRTAILLNKDGDFEAFGTDAIRGYIMYPFKYI